MQNCLELARLKMAEDSTPSSPWALLCIHCNILAYAKWRTHRCHDQKRPKSRKWKSPPLNQKSWNNSPVVSLWNYPVHKNWQPWTPWPFAFWEDSLSECVSLNKPAFALLWLLVNYFLCKVRILTWWPSQGHIWELGQDHPLTPYFPETLLRWERLLFLRRTF